MTDPLRDVFDGLGLGAASDARTSSRDKELLDDALNTIREVKRLSSEGFTIRTLNAFVTKWEKRGRKLW